MKKLRLTDEEKKNFIIEVYNKLNNMIGIGIENINFNDIKINASKIPKDTPKPIVRIVPEAYVQMLELVRQSPVEISWHGLVQRDKEENVYTVYEILVFPQINSATTTTADEKGFAEWQTKLIADMDFPIKDLRMHGHSHVNMNVFSSSIDDQYQEDLLHKVEDGDYYLFLIMNKKMEICPLLYDLDKQIMFDHNDIKLEIGYVDDIIDWAANEIKENCEEMKTVKMTRGTGHNYSWDDEYGGYYFDDYDKPLIGKPKTVKAIKGGKKNGSK